MTNIDDLIPGLTSFMSDDVVESVADSDTELDDIESEIDDIKADEAELDEQVSMYDARLIKSAQLLDECNHMLTHVKTYGVDRSFLSLCNYDNRLGRCFNMEFPACESMSSVGDPTSSESIACLEGLKEVWDKIWKFICDTAAAIAQWFREQKAKWKQRISTFTAWLAKTFKYRKDNQDTSNTNGPYKPTDEDVWRAAQNKGNASGMKYPGSWYKDVKQQSGPTAAISGPATKPAANAAKPTSRRYKVYQLSALQSTFDYINKVASSAMDRTSTDLENLVSDLANMARNAQMSTVSNRGAQIESVAKSLNEAVAHLRSLEQHDTATMVFADQSDNTAEQYGQFLSTVLAKMSQLINDPRYDKMIEHVKQIQSIRIATRSGNIDDFLDEYRQAGHLFSRAVINWRKAYRALIGGLTFVCDAADESIRAMRRVAKAKAA